MATLSTLPLADRRTQVFSRFTRSDALTVAASTAIAFLLLGYHPYAEDGGIYASAAALRLDPSLFPLERGFAVAHTTHSLFIPLMFAIPRALHLPLATGLFLAYLVTIAATMVAAAALARLLFVSPQSQRWAVLTLAVSMGLPIAGTSLYLADPYLTARSLSTPLLLCCIHLLLSRRTVTAFALLAVAFAIHPLMAFWAALLFAAVLTRRSSRPLLSTVLLALVSLTGMAVVQAVAPVERSAVRLASLSREYWFVSQWDWYEIVGMLAPIVLLTAIFFLHRRDTMRPGLRDAAIAAASAAAIVSVGSVAFIHPGDGSMLLARLQPLRLLHSVYLIFVLIAGGLLPTVRLRGRAHVGWIACPLAAAGLFFMQRQTYPSSAHMELPWVEPVNGYERAFVWSRDHTPTDVLFALDADYTTAPGEDAQLFRAIALRSSLPDAAKDGGIASVMPKLAPAWLAAAEAQRRLNDVSDDERIARVKPLGATWIVLPSGSKTSFDCPYTNEVARVCRLPQ